ncbi:IclR family transcriptional regulator [Nocardia asiatica]|uniref:IclR family transcriptional regulator n=1 Tax=Nocardia asiatica TaxID=209252 RepID=UPI0002EA178F|nr:IclR family transcriptional regulator [Nocardia asiatica]
MSDQPAKRTGMQSVLKSLEVLEAVAKSQPVGISALGRELDIPKTTVHRILRTLADAGWVAPQGAPGEQRWVLTARALAVGASVMSQDDLRERARPVMAELGERTEENIHLSVPDGDVLVLIERVPSSRPVQTVVSVGERAPIILTASGWAYLSRLPGAEAAARIPDDIAVADGGHLTREAVLAELRDAAARGYSMNRGRWRSDVSAIGSAVCDRQGRPIATLSISMPTYRLTGDLPELYGSLLAAATSRVSAEIARG